MLSILSLFVYIRASEIIDIAAMGTKLLVHLFMACIY